MQAPKEFAMPRLGETVLLTHSDIRSNGSETAPAIVTRVWSFDCVNLTDVRTRWIENGERELEAILTETAAAAQACLDDNYANLPQP